MWKLNGQMDGGFSRTSEMVESGYDLGGVILLCSGLLHCCFARLACLLTNRRASRLFYDLCSAIRQLSSFARHDEIVTSMVHFSYMRPIGHRTC